MKCKIGDLFTEFHSGDSLPSENIKERGLYVVYGANGQRGYYNEYNSDGRYVIIGRQGAYCGNVNYYEGKAFLTEHAILGKVKEEHDHTFLCYYLRSINLSQFQGQSAQPGLSVKTLSHIEIDVPEYKVQHNVGEILRTIESKIALNRKANEVLESMAKQLYDYWFVQFDFPNAEGKPYKSSGGKMVYNETLKREIPEGWEVVCLGETFEHNRGISYNTQTITGDGIPMINLASFNVDGTYKPAGIKSYNGEYSEDKVLKPYDLVMCNTQQTAIDYSKDIIGKAFLVPDLSSGEIVSSHHVTTIKPYNNDLKAYYCYLFNTQHFHRYAARCSSGTNIMGLDFGGIERYITELPTSNLLHIFSEYIINIQKRKSLILKEILRITSLRDYLLPLLMNGQVKCLDSMNRLVIIGNGFDLAHGLKTSYADFINWYWEQRKIKLYTLQAYLSKDDLCELTLFKDSGQETWMNLFLFNSYIKKYQGTEFLKFIKNKGKAVRVSMSDFFENIHLSIEIKGWVDIENEYYTLLKKNKGSNYTCKELNKQLLCLQELLIEYLSTQKVDKNDINYQSIILEDIKEQDISSDGKEKVKNDIESRKCDPFDMMDPEHIMLLSFNYTPTVKLYQNRNIEYNFIHGTLEKPESIIFGFGDELDKDYRDIQEANDNELLTNIKSVKYLEAPNYRDLLRFIESAPFQILIMGHSCGLSDRTLLNTIFEHNNCVSIKPFYYRKPDGSDNYLELVQNISRNFTDMKLFRDRVVNKTQCEQM